MSMKPTVCGRLASSSFLIGIAADAAATSDPEMVARGAAYYFFGIGTLAVLVSLWIQPVFHVIMPERYWVATTSVPPRALAAAGAGA